jgi:hypothetical protein
LRTRFVSALDKIVVPRWLRRVALERLRILCFLFAWVALTLPVAVKENRFLAALFDFSFGMFSSNYKLYYDAGGIALWAISLSPNFSWDAAYIIISWNWQVLLENRLTNQPTEIYDKSGRSFIHVIIMKQNYDIFGYVKIFSRQIKSIT